MALRHCLALLAAVLPALLAGCAQEDELRPGCTPPPHEERLLDAYRDDPVFKVRPPGVQKAGAPRDSKACRILNEEDTSFTNVTLTLHGDHPYGRPELLSVYDADLQRAGWRPAATPADSLQYCRDVAGVPSDLQIDGYPDSSVIVSMAAEPDGGCD
ncbi:hypothetical protein [Dactylosporangium sp. NPDC049140]|jgi:hypothetical protein|uniref:hypothetical protein n=1 Tax=Dactylosporangium sp. NPDC049140 TaxID=3155647 RepID=UPI0033CA8061